MTYSNATFYIDPTNGSDSARTALTSCTASNPSGSVTRINKTGHGLSTGAVVDLTLFSSWLNDAWKITVVDADNFDLDGAVWQTTGDNSGTTTPRGGSSKTDAWKTLGSGATAARIQPGDTVRVMRSPQPTLLDSGASWTTNSRAVTLSGAVTANISTCESAWTASANVTATTTSTCKEGSLAANIAIASGFTTGLAAYFATGSLNLSGYQQVSLWVRCNNTLAASTLSLKLCTDTVGAVPVHTIPIPAVASADVFFPVTVDFGGNLNSAIQSVALYCDADPGAVTVILDNILACKASSSADSLTLHSRIGKVHALSYVAGTTYSTGAIRKPSPPNRNGYAYTATVGGTTSGVEPTWPTTIGATVTDGAVTWTCSGLEETYYALKSINGTALTLDEGNDSGAGSGRGYHGASETVATYKRESFLFTMGTGNHQTIQDSGTVNSPIVFTGGWDTTNMSVMDGETWFDGQNSRGVGLWVDARSYITVNNLSFSRVQTGINGSSPCTYSTFTNCHLNNIRFEAISADLRMVFAQGLSLQGCGSVGWQGRSPATIKARAVTMSNNASEGFNSNNSNQTYLEITDAVCKNNGSYGLIHASYAPAKLTGIVTGSNVLGGLSVSPGTQLNNCLVPESTELNTFASNIDATVFSQRHDQTANNHKIFMDGGTISSATDQRHTASDISWKFSPTSTLRGAAYPMRMTVAQIPCVANTPVNVAIWTYRDNTNIQGRLYVEAGQVPGVGDVSVSCAPSINTWVKSSTLTFTPTENGVVEVKFLVWDGVGTSNNFWLDDVEVS